MTMRADYTPSPLTAAVLEEVRVKLTRHDWTVAEFARRLDQSQSHINSIIRGRSSLTVDALAEWCDLLGVDIVELINDAQARSGRGTRDEPTQADLDAVIERVTKEPPGGHGRRKRGPTRS